MTNLKLFLLTLADPCRLMMNGRNNGKKIMAVRIVQHAFEIIFLVTEQNPIQVLGAHVFVLNSSAADRPLLLSYLMLCFSYILHPYSRYLA